MIIKIFFLLASTILIADTSLFNRSAVDMLEDIQKNKNYKRKTQRSAYIDERKEEKKDTIELDFRKLEIRRIKHIKSKV